MKDNYFLIAKLFANIYNLNTGNPYVVKKGKDYKHLKAVSVVTKDITWGELFDKFFEWHKDSVWCRDNNVPPTLGLLEASINSVVSFKKPDNVNNKGLFL